MTGECVFMTNECALMKNTHSKMTDECVFFRIWSLKETPKSEWIIDNESFVWCFRVVNVLKNTIIRTLWNENLNEQIAHNL